MEFDPFGLSVKDLATRSMLVRYNTDYKHCAMLVDTQAKVSSDAGAHVIDLTAYRSLAGALHYLTFTKPDISYVVQ
jgi:hypothetical protein